MKIDAKPSENGITLEIRLEAKELAESFSEVFNGWELRKLITKLIVSDTGPLAAEIGRQVSIAIANPSIVDNCRRAVETGIVAATASVRDHLHESGIKAAKNALGHFLAKSFAKLRKGLEFDSEMQATADSVCVPDSEGAGAKFREEFERREFERKTKDDLVIPENGDFFDRYNGGAP